MRDNTLVTAYGFGKMRLVGGIRFLWSADTHFRSNVQQMCSSSHIQQPPLCTVEDKNAVARICGGDSGGAGVVQSPDGSFTV
eukprot:3311756-Rhodomonas_salina.1